MPVSIDERIQSLRDAINSDDWDAFDALLDSWADGELDAAWIDAGKVLSRLARREVLSGDDRKIVVAVDERLGRQVGAIDDLNGNRVDDAQDAIVAEIASGTDDIDWLEAYWTVSSTPDDPIKALYSAPNLVAACVLEKGEVKSMTAKGSRMSADSLGQWTTTIWDEVEKLNSQIPIGNVRSIQVAAEDGGWIVVRDSDDPEYLVTALVAAPSAAAEAYARASVVVSTTKEAE